MARIRGHAILREDRPLFVLKAQMTVDGREFKRGDAFPWQELQGITPRLLRMLWDQRKIGHEKPEDPAQGAEEPLRSPQEQARADARDAGRKQNGAPQGKPRPAAVRGLG